MIRGVLFDMDGVLLDTERLSMQLLPAASERFGYPMPNELYMRLLGTNDLLSTQILTEYYGESYPHSEIMDAYHNDLLDVAHEGRLPLKKGLVDCFSGLRSRGLKCALATSTTRSIVMDYIAHIPAMQNVFDEIVCGSEVASSKPAPDIYLEAMRRIGLTAAECLGVEDSLNGLKSLKAAGVAGVMIPDLLPPDERFGGLIAYQLKDLTQLCPLIDRVNFGAKVRG